MLEGLVWDDPVSAYARQGEVWSIAVRSRMRTHWDLYRRRNRAGDGGASGKSRRVKRGGVVPSGKSRFLQRDAVAGGPGENGENGLFLGRPAALLTNRQEAGLRSLTSCRPGARLTRKLHVGEGRTVAPTRPDRPSLAGFLGTAAAFLSHGALAAVRGRGGAWPRYRLQEPIDG